MTLNHLSYESPELGYPWLNELSPTEWNTVFDQAKRVLKAINAGKDDPRLAITLRQDKEKRLAVIYGLNYITGFYIKGDQVMMRYYFSKERNIADYPGMEASVEDFKDGAFLAYAPLVEFSKQEKAKEDSLIDTVEYAKVAAHSSFKRTHIPWLWDVIFKPEARKEFFDYIRATPQERILTIYKASLKEKGLKDEIYKWKLINNFRKNWDLEADDFGAMMNKSLKMHNLVSNQALSFFGEASLHPEESKEYFSLIFQESVPVKDRIAHSKLKGKELLKAWRPEWFTAAQDERTLSWLWSFKDLDDIFPYKDSFYSKYCKYIGIRPARAGNKLLHYMELCEQFLKDHVLQDNELLEQHNALLPEELKSIDPNYHLLTQNILYVVFDQLWKQENDAYWIFQGNPSVIDFESAIRAGVLKYVNVKNHKGKIKPGDKGIFYITGEYAGVYGLVTVTSFPAEREEQEGGLLFVDVEFDVNLVNTPILKSRLDQVESLSKLNVGVQGTNFSATKQEYETIFSMAKEQTKSGNNKSNMNSLNTILYGPPGTGKTYNTIDLAVQIAEPDKYKEDLHEHNKLIYDDLVEEKRIVFTTFHQSMSYEDFIEGIKPVIDSAGVSEKVEYQIQPGIFKSICKDATSIKNSDIKIDWDTPNYFKMSLGGKDRQDIHQWCIDNNVISMGWGKDKDLTPLADKKTWEGYRDKFNGLFPQLVEESRFSIQAAFIFQQSMQIGDIVVVSIGNQIIDAIGKIEGDYYYDDSQPIEYFHFRKVTWIATNLANNPSKFVKNQITQQSIYKFAKEDIKIDSFKDITQIDKKQSTAKPYVLIIDEINRGNISQIFGELITLIEENKRLGNKESLEVTLPYSQKSFGVPPNLYILGTMNTADRSVEALDTALRRRFSFVEMMPDPKVIVEKGALKVSKGILNDVINLPQLLSKINERIEALLDRDHQIGHSYFLKVNSLDDLKHVFHNKIIPLLQEYFFGDYGKIGLIMGQGFFEKNRVVTDSLYASIEGYDAVDFSDRTIFRLKNVSAMENEEFSTAVDLLLK